MARATAKKPPPASTSQSGTRYEDDRYIWLNEQVELLRAGRLTELDAHNLAEELGDVAKMIEHQLESSIAVLTQHLLKWDHQPERRSRSWESTIREQRRRIARLIAKNPRLKGALAEALQEGYLDGRDRAIGETNIDKSAFPVSCPYIFEAMMQREIEFAPDQLARLAGTT
jgi:hypothetical protein